MRVCVFCGSSPARNPRFGRAAETLGRLFAERGIDLVYGGGRVGLMGTIADATLAAGGTAIGVMPAALVDREIAHTGLSELIVVESMHERKARMAELSDAFVTLPGGIGTLEELFEIWTWAQIGLHHKAVGLLDVDAFFSPLRAMLDTMVDEGFLRSVGRDSLLVEDEPRRLLDRFASYVPPPDRWSRAATVPASQSDAP